MTDVHAGASSMKVAVGQFAAGSDKRANLERISTLSEEAARTGARLVVFPEGAMHTFGELTDDLSPAAESLDGRFVSELSRLASRLRLTLVAGMFEAIPGEKQEQGAERAPFDEGALFQAVGFDQTKLTETAPERIPPARPQSEKPRLRGFLKRTTGLEPATFGLGSRRSTN